MCVTSVTVQNSPTGTRTWVARVRAANDNRLHHGGPDPAVLDAVGQAGAPPLRQEMLAKPSEPRCLWEGAHSLFIRGEKGTGVWSLVTLFFKKASSPLTQTWLVACALSQRTQHSKH